MDEVGQRAFQVRKQQYSHFIDRILITLVNERHEQLLKSIALGYWPAARVARDRWLQLSIVREIFQIREDPVGMNIIKNEAPSKDCVEILSFGVSRWT